MVLELFFFPNDAASLASILTHSHLDMNTTTTFDATLLDIAAMNGHFDTVTYLLNHPNIDVNQADGNKHVMALLADEDDIAQLLLNAFCDSLLEERLVAGQSP